MATLDALQVTMARQEMMISQLLETIAGLNVTIAGLKMDGAGQSTVPLTTDCAKQINLQNELASFKKL